MCLNPLLMGDSLLTARIAGGCSGIPQCLNPLLMGDSLLTCCERKPGNRLHRVSIPFSWGTHFSPRVNFARE